MVQSNAGNPVTQTEDVKLERPIGLLGGIALVTGGVIGMGIYALIAAVGAQAGSALWLAFILAITVSAIGVLPLIQIASALPRAGGGYLFTSRLLNPTLGMITSYLAILGGASSVALVSVGLAQYITPYLPFSLPTRIVAALLPILFFVLYLFGLRLATSLQTILVAQLIIALLVYGLTGATKVDLNFSVNLPQGVGGLIMASILCYSVCMGFQVIAELGEEMIHAKRNIPLSMLIGGLIILTIYIIVGTVFISSVPYDFETIKAMNAPLMETGKMFLSDFWVFFLSLGALSAGLTSFNAGAIALPRELFSQARDGIVPAFLGKISPHSHTPLNAVAVFFGFTVVLILLGQSLDFYGVMTAVGILLMTAIIAIAGIRLPVKFPERYKHAYIRIPRFLLWIIMFISVLSCLGFVFIVLMELPVVGIIYATWVVLVLVYYFFRRNSLIKSGVDWKARVTRIPGFDED